MLFLNSRRICFQILNSLLYKKVSWRVIFHPSIFSSFSSILGWIDEISSIPIIFGHFAIFHPFTLFSSIGHFFIQNPNFPIYIEVGVLIIAFGGLQRDIECRGFEVRVLVFCAGFWFWVFYLCLVFWFRVLGSIWCRILVFLVSTWRG